MNTNDVQLAALNAYFQLMNMNGASRVYRAAQELGVHDALRNGAASAAEVAGTCDLQEAPVGLLLDSLCALGTVTAVTVRVVSTASLRRKNSSITRDGSISCRLPTAFATTPP